METPTDRLGNEIKVGDRVAVATASGRNVSLQVGTIMGIRTYRYYDHLGAKFAIEWEDRKFTRWLYDPETHKSRTIELENKLTTIYDAKRMLVISGSN